VEGHQYAITVVYAVSARNAKGVKNEANGTEAHSSNCSSLLSNRQL